MLVGAPPGGHQSHGSRPARRRCTCSVAQMLQRRPCAERQRRCVEQRELRHEQRSVGLLVHGAVQHRRRGHACEQVAQLEGACRNHAAPAACDQGRRGAGKMVGAAQAAARTSNPPPPLPPRVRRSASALAQPADGGAHLEGFSQRIRTHKSLPGWCLCCTGAPRGWGQRQRRST